MRPFGVAESDPVRHITKRAVDKLRLGETIWDTELQGFGVSAESDGKFYFLSTSIGGAQERSRIGRHGDPWSPEDARLEAWKRKAELIRAADASIGRSSRITSWVVEHLEPGQTAWDSKVKGFGVRCQRTSKVYVLKTRVGGRQRWFTIGPDGKDWTPESARREAQRLVDEITGGQDPAELRDPRQREMTVAALCDLYITEGCAGKTGQAVTTEKRRVEREIKPYLGKKKAASVSVSDIERFARSLASGGAPGASGKAPAAAKSNAEAKAAKSKASKNTRGTVTRALTLASAIFAFAETRGVRQDNPVDALKDRLGQNGRSFMTPADLDQVGAALSSAESAGEDPVAIAAIRFLILTGRRQSDLAAMRWSDVDVGRGCLSLRTSDRQEKRILLSPPALAVLATLQRSRPDQLVFSGGTAAAKLPGLSKIWRRISTRAGFPDLKIPDIRRNFPKADATDSALASIASPTRHEAINAAGPGRSHGTNGGSSRADSVSDAGSRPAGRAKGGQDPASAASTRVA